MSSTLTYLDSYCERAGDPSIWAEPLNAATNLFFIWFAFKSFQLIRKMPDTSFRRTGDIWALTFAMFTIGIGSGLWHTYARQWSVMADVIPIGIFINLYIFSLFMRLAGFRFWQAGLAWAMFQGLSIAAELYLPRDFLNGSVMYLPTLMVLGAAVGWLKWCERDSWNELGFIALMFVGSLIFRTMDLSVCDTFPVGTHFVWHMVNAVVLFRLVRLLVANTHPKTGN